MSSSDLNPLPTLSLLLDEGRMLRNIRRIEDRARALTATLRPHLKTAKSMDVARRLSGGVPGPITVSTLVEAELSFDAGHADILYAVGIAPGKLDRAAALRARGGVTHAGESYTVSRREGISATGSPS